MTDPRKNLSWVRPPAAPLIRARIERDKNGQFYSVISSANGKDLFQSSESYVRADHTERMVRKYYGDIPVAHKY